MTRKLSVTVERNFSPFCGRVSSKNALIASVNCLKLAWERLCVACRCMTPHRRSIGFRCGAQDGRKCNFRQHSGRSSQCFSIFAWWYRALSEIRWTVRASGQAFSMSLNRSSVVLALIRSPCTRTSRISSRSRAVWMFRRCRPVVVLTAGRSSLVNHPWVGRDWCSGCTASTKTPFSSGGKPSRRRSYCAIKSFCAAGSACFGSRSGRLQSKPR